MTDINPYGAPRTGPNVAPPNGGLAWLLFSFEGRIPRRHFWAVSLAVGFVWGVAVNAIPAILGRESAQAGVAILILAIPVVWISLAIAIKRWHDRDKSGWWILINLIPIVGGIWSFVETGCLRGAYGPNQYGTDPT